MTKQFRISELRVRRIAVDTEPSIVRTITKTGKKTEPQEGWQDIVVTLINDDGSRFEVQRITICSEDLFVGSDTSVADLAVRRSWGEEGKDKDDPSVSCPLCLFHGHGAGVCKDLKKGKHAPTT